MNEDPKAPEVPTPDESGNPITTPAGAETPATTPPSAENTGTSESESDRIEKIVKSRLGRAQKQWEAERDETAKRARMEEADRLKAELADKDKLIEQHKADAVTAHRTAALTGKVVNPAAALKLLEAEKHLDADGNINTEALLKDFPWLAVEASKRVDLPSARTADGATGTLKPDDFKGKDPAWIRENLHRLKAD